MGIRDVSGWIMGSFIGSLCSLFVFVECVNICLDMLRSW